MTNKELQKLGRRELLQLLLEQAKEAERLGKMLKENDAQLKQLEESYERLRERLDQKDAAIRELKDTLQSEREKREVELSQVGSIAEAALRLNGVFDAAQQAAEQYLQAVQQFYPLPEGVTPPPMPDLSRLQAQVQAQAQYQQQAPCQQAVYQPPYQPQPWVQPQPQPQGPFQSPDPFPYQSYQFPYFDPAPPVGGAESYSPARSGRTGQGKLPFGVKKSKESGKATLLFGWQHH